MRLLANKLKAMEKKNGSKPNARRNQDDCKSLKPSDGFVLSKVKKSKVKKSKVKESKVSSSKEDDVVAAVPVALAWERCVMNFSLQGTRSLAEFKEDLLGSLLSSSV